MKYIEPNWPAPAHVKAFTTTRLSVKEEMAMLLKLPSQPIWLKQIHGSNVVRATQECVGDSADASFSFEPNLVCAVQTADCIPILISHQKGTCVAAIHAGWRGLAAGVIEATLNALQQPADELLVWLGPAISAKKFEVGQDVFDVFVKQHQQSAQAFTKISEDKWLADLYALAKLRLKTNYIQHIYGGNFCTYTQEELFYSYRRDQGNTGRMVSLVWING